MQIDEQDVNTAGTPELESAEAPIVQDATESVSEPAEAGAEAPEGADAAETAATPPPSMPYGRFREVVAQKNEIQRRLAETEALLNQYRQQAPTAPSRSTQPAAPTGQDNGAAKYMRDLMDPLMQEYLAPLRDVKAQIDTLKQAQERELFRARYAGKVDSDVLTLAEKQYEVARAMGLDKVSPDDVLKAVLGDMVLNGAVTARGAAAASRTQVAKVNAAAKTPAPRGRAPEAKFDPSDPNVTADQLLAWAEQNGVSGF